MAYQKLTFADYQKKKEAQISEILEKFEKMSMNELSLKLADRYVTKIGAPMEKWTFMNQLLAEIAGTDDARSFKAWAKAGSPVRAGERAFYIWKPVSVMVKEYDAKYFGTEEQEKNYRIRYLNMEQAKHLAYNQERIGTQFGLQPEFRIEQTTKPETIKHENEPIELPPLMNVCKQLGIKISWKKYKHDGSAGAYSPRRKIIELNAYDEKVFFHEITHAVQHHIEGTIKGGQDINQETIAEFTSCVIASIYGIDSSKQAAAYIFHYNKNDKEQAMKTINKNLDTVKKCLDFMFQCEGTQ